MFLLRHVQELNAAVNTANELRSARMSIDTYRRIISLLPLPWEAGEKLRETNLWRD